MVDILGQVTKALSVEPESADLTKGDRNKNAGNLEDGAFARSQPGYAGSDGRFAKFKDEESGRRAQEALLAKKYAGKSPSQVVQKYAPLGENSEASVRNYIGYASAVAGIDPDKPVPPEKMAAFAQGMREFETGKRSIKSFKPYGGQVRGAGRVATGPQQGVSNPGRFLAGLESTLGPQAAASGNVSSQASAIFGSDQEMNRRAAEVETQINEQGNAISVLDQAQTALQATTQASLETQVEESRAISSEISKGTEELKTKVTPVIQARARVADQLDKLNTMNPLERGVRGIFDLNYDRNYLESQLDHYDKTMESRAKDYDYLNKLHNVALQEVDRRFKNDTAIPGLMVDQAKEDLGIVGLRLQQTASSLGNLQDLIKGQTQLISAKAAAREDILGRIDGPTLGQLAAQAKANGGPVKFGGVELSYNELYERQQAKETQDLHMESVRTNIAAGRMDMADKYANMVAGTLTREETEGAIANGGVYKGIQLPTDALTRNLNNHMQQGQMLAAEAANSIPAKAALKVGVDALNMTTGIYERTRGMYGIQDNQQASSIMNEGTLAIRALTEATRTGQSPEVIAVLTQKVAQTTAKMQEHTDGVILRQVGGDKRAAAYLKGFTYGTPMNQGTAVEALTYFAVKGTMPTGMQVSPEAKQIFQKTQLEVETLRKANGGKDPKTGKPWTETGLTAAVSAKMATTAADTVGQSRFNEIYKDLPLIANRMNHPLGKLKAADWQRVQWQAQKDAAQAVATQTGLDLTAVMEMNQRNAPLNDTPQAKADYEKFNNASGKWNDAENRSLVMGLDELEPITAGRRNSSVMLDFMSSGRMSKFVNQYTGARGASSFGDYLVNPLSAGATEAKVSDFGKNFHDAQTTEYDTRRQIARSFPAGKLTNPLDRTMLILSSMPGVSTGGAAKLKPFIANVVKPYMTRPGDRSQNLQFMMQEQDAAVLEALKSTKFPDPGMETLRKNAVASWGQHSTQAKGFIESMISAAQAGL